MDVDIYGDIDNFDFGEQLEQVRNENVELRNTILRMQKALEDIGKELTQLKEANAKLEFNISALYRTAKTEFDRKNKLISELRKQVDSGSLYKGKMVNIPPDKMVQEMEVLRLEYERAKTMITTKTRLVKSLSNELCNLRKQMELKKIESKRDCSHLDKDEGTESSKRQKLQSPEIEARSKERVHRSRSPEFDRSNRHRKSFKLRFDQRGKFRHPYSPRRNSFPRHRNSLDQSRYLRASRSRSRTPMSDLKFKSSKKVQHYEAYKPSGRKSISVETSLSSYNELITDELEPRNYEENLTAYKIFALETDDKKDDAKSNIVEVNSHEELTANKINVTQFENVNIGAKSASITIKNGLEEPNKDDPVSEAEEGELNSCVESSDDAENITKPRKSLPTAINITSHNKNFPVLQKNNPNVDEKCYENKISNKTNLTDNYKIEKRKNTDKNCQKLNKEENGEDTTTKENKPNEKCQKRDINKDLRIENKLIINIDKDKICNLVNLVPIEKDIHEKKHNTDNSKLDTNYKIPKKINCESKTNKSDCIKVTEIETMNKENNKFDKLQSNKICSEAIREKQSHKIDKSSKLKKTDLFEDDKKQKIGSSYKNKSQIKAGNKKIEGKTELADKNRKKSSKKNVEEKLFELFHPDEKVSKYVKNNKEMDKSALELSGKDKKVNTQKPTAEDENNYELPVSLDELGLIELEKKMTVIKSQITKLGKGKSKEDTKPKKCNEEVKKNKVKPIKTGKPRSFLKHAMEYEKQTIEFSPQKQITASPVAVSRLQETVPTAVPSKIIDVTIEPITNNINKSTVSNAIFVDKSVELDISVEIIAIPLNKSVATNATSLNKSVETIGTPLNKPVKTSVTSLNKPVQTSATSLNKPVQTTATSLNKPVKTNATPLHVSVETNAISVNKSVATNATPLQISVETNATALNKLVETNATPLQKSLEQIATLVNKSVKTNATALNNSVEPIATPANKSVETISTPLNKSVETNVSAPNKSSEINASARRPPMRGRRRRCVITITKRD